MMTQGKAASGVAVCCYLLLLLGVATSFCGAVRVGESDHASPKKDHASPKKASTKVTDDKHKHSSGHASTSGAHKKGSGRLPEDEFICEAFGQSFPMRYESGSQWAEGGLKQITLSCSNGFLGLGLIGGKKLQYQYMEGGQVKDQDELPLDPEKAKSYILSTEEHERNGFEIPFPKGGVLKAKLMAKSSMAFPENLKITSPALPAPEVFAKSFNGGRTVLPITDDSTWGQSSSWA